MYTYKQATGEMIDDAGRVIGVGYSGYGTYKNDPSMENVANLGPIPRGGYTMEGPVTSHVHGPYAIPLVPDSDNEMFGRDGFLCHGDSVVEPGSASEGCIIQPHDTRVKMWESGDHRIEVV